MNNANIETLAGDVEAGRSCAATEDKGGGRPDETVESSHGSSARSFKT